MARLNHARALAAQQTRRRRARSTLLAVVAAVAVILLLPGNKQQTSQTAVGSTPQQDAAAAQQQPAGTVAVAQAAEGAGSGISASTATDAAAAVASDAVATEGAAAAQQQEQQAVEGAAGSSAANAGSDGDSIHTGIFFNVAKDGEPEQMMELLNEPVPEDCHMEEHADYDGPALTWGLNYKKQSAAQCCQACKEWPAGPEGRCNIWVWCGDPSGLCWSPDIWNHTTGECWLKFQKDWDNNVDRAATNLKVNDRGDYVAAYRQEHKTAPERVAWTAGLIPAH